MSLGPSPILTHHTGTHHSDTPLGVPITSRITQSTPHLYSFDTTEFSKNTEYNVMRQRAYKTGLPQVSPWCTLHSADWGQSVIVTLAVIGAPPQPLDRSFDSRLVYKVLCVCLSFSWQTLTERLEQEGAKSLLPWIYSSRGERHSEEWLLCVVPGVHKGFEVQSMTLGHRLTQQSSPV